MKKRFSMMGIIALVMLMSLSAFPEVVQASDRVDNMMSTMTTRDKVLQLIMPDFRNWKESGSEQIAFTEMNPEVKQILHDYNFGGVILFAENVKATEQTARLVDSLQNEAIASEDAVPMLIGIDQEGGIVYRLGTGTALPGNMAVGATRSEEYAKNVGQIIGRELSSLGINVNFAPVMDVNNNPRNAVIGLRSYSSNPELVAKMGVATIQGLKEYNVSGAAKHFPGHGDTAVDSHYGLPMVDKSLEELKKMEFIPFQAAIDEGIDMIMTAHMMFPKLDAEYPATLSHNILTGVVRDNMGYEGVIITDAMNMKAIADNFGEIDAAKIAINAGVDIVLMPTILRQMSDIDTKLIPMIDELVESADTDPLFMARVNESTKRVLNLKNERGILDYATTNTPIAEKVSKALAEVGSEMNRNLERKIARDAVTVVKNDENKLPFKVQENDKIVLFGAYDNELPGMAFSIRRLISEGFIPESAVVETTLLRNYDNGWVPLTREQIQAKISDADHVVVISEVGNEANLKMTSWLTSVPTMIIEEANGLDINSAIMSISKPYDTANYPDAKSVVAVFGAKGMDPTEGLRPDNAFGPNIPAGIEVIFGEGNAAGKLPVDLPLIDENHVMTDEIAYPFGHGLTLNELIESVEVVVPESTKLEDSFETSIHIHEFDLIKNQNYTMEVVYDSELFEANEALKASDGSIMIDDLSAEVRLQFTAKTDGGNLAPIKTIILRDTNGRVFSLGEDYYTEYTVNVIKTEVPTDPGTDPKPTDPGTDPKPTDPKPTEPGTDPKPTSPDKDNGGKLPSTGESISTLLIASGISVLAGLFLVLKNRYSRERS